VNQLGQYSAGVYSASFFGSEGLPTVRGVYAEAYQNGQRMHSYLNSFPPSFNSVEAIDIVKGPGSAVYGPSTSYMGGYVNYVTKQPYFDKLQGQISTTLGNYAPGGMSYRRDEWTVDAGGPLIKDKLAFRMSYTGREGERFYNNTHDDVEDIFAALAYIPYEDLKVDWTGQFYESRFNEVAGFNRPTQTLVDKQLYVSGPVQTGLGGTFVGYTPGQNTSPPNGISQANGFYGSAVVTPLNGTDYSANLRKIYANQALVAPGDNAYGKRAVTQLTVTKTSDDFTLTNRSYGEYLESRKYSAYGYDEYVPENLTASNRTEFKFNFDTPFGESGGGETMKDSKALKSVAGKKKEEPYSIGHELITGFDLRYDKSIVYQDFTNEPFQQYDILQPGGTQYYSRLVSFGAGGSGSRLVPGHPGYTGTYVPFLVTSSDSDIAQEGIFVQDEFKFTPEISTILGFRGDFYQAWAGDPAYGPTLDGSNPNGINESKRQQANATNFSEFASFTYKPVKNVTTYVTYDRVNGINFNQFGGISNFSHNPDGSTFIPESFFKEVSELYEGGVKTSLLDDKLYVGVAGFYQTRVSHNQIGDAQDVETRGIEIETTYQPDKHLSLTGNFTWEEANYNNSGVYSQTGYYLDTFAAGVPVENGKTGTGYGSPNYNSGPKALGKGDYRLTGLPSILFNAYAIYKLDCGLSFGLGPQVQSDQIADLQGEITIPAQFTWNGFVSYARKSWEVRVNLFNITDERNYTAGAPGFAANDLIYAEEPFHLNGTVKFKF
jgi:hypothetical protein